MTPPPCKFCNKPIDEHDASGKTNVCVAKAKGWKMVSLGSNKRTYGYRPVNPEEMAIGTTSEIPHYSTDIRDAMPLWKLGWHIWHDEDIYFIDNVDRNCICTAETLPVALCHATLIQAKEKP